MGTNILSDYEQIFKTLKTYGNDTIIEHVKKYKELDQYLPPGNTWFIITNTQERTFPFVSKNFEYNLGLDIHKMYTEGMPYWLSHIHPEEQEIWVRILGELMAITQEEVEPEKRLLLTYNWNYRFKSGKGEYLNVFINISPIVLDDSYRPIIGLTSATVIGHNKPMPIKASIKLLNTHNEYETIYSKNYSQNLLMGPLSLREQDIIRLVALNKTSKEIGKSLFISSHTVDTHRRNIIKKLKLSSTKELITYFKNEILF